MRIKALVLAAGLGERMKSNLPKVSHEVLGTPMIKYVINSIKSTGVSDIIVVIGHKKDIVKDILGNNVRYVIQKEQKGTAHAVTTARKLLADFKGTLLVLNGDVPLVTAETIKKLSKTSTADCVLASAFLDDPTGYGRIVRDEKGNLVKIVEEQDAIDKTINEVNAGFYTFKVPKIFDFLRMTRPDNAKHEYYLTDAIEIIIKQGGRVETIRLTDPREAYGVNSRKDLVTVTNFLRTRIIEQHIQQGVTIVDPSTTYIESDVKIGIDTIIHPFSVIRSGVVIGKICRIGPFSHIRSDSVVDDFSQIGNFVEVKKTKIGKYSQAKHLSYLGDAILGSYVNIGAGTITANYDGRRKNTTVIKDRASTGCNTVLIAPITMGKDSKTGAGAIVPKNRDVKPGDIVVGVPARSLRQAQAARLSLRQVKTPSVSRGSRRVEALSISKGLNKKR